MREDARAINYIQAEILQSIINAAIRVNEWSHNFSQ